MSPPPLVVPVAVALCLSLFGSVASAGSLGDFRDSIAPDPDSDDSPQRGGGSDRGDRSHGRNRGGYDEDDEDGVCETIAGCILVHLLSSLIAGDRPGDEFSWGETPYDGRGTGSFSWGDTPYEGRGRLAGLDVRGSEVPDVAALARPNRPGHFRGRAEVLTLTDGSAMGLGGFALVESSRAPGLALWHQQLMDFHARDRLGVTALTLEPRIITQAAAVVSWNIGGVMYGSENGLVNGGLQLGLGMAFTPVRPLALETRLAAHVMPDAAVGDLYVGLGVEVHPGVFTTVGYRTLIGPETPLRAVTAGVQVDLGFGGRRRADGLASR